MRLDLIALKLEKALKYPGCPICTIQLNHEQRYIHAFLWENVNDPDTRRHIVATLGYCPQHTWQLGFAEIQAFGSSINNNSIYRDLAGIVRGRLKQYIDRVMKPQQPGWKRWIRWVQPGFFPFPYPDEMQPRAECRICEIGAQTARTHLERLLQQLSNQDDDFQKQYITSDGLCLKHLRLGFALANRNMEAGVKFLAENAIQRLAVLEHDLDEFNRKDALHQDVEKTEEEKRACLHALTFFGGNRNDDYSHAP